MHLRIIACSQCSPEFDQAMTRETRHLEGADAEDYRNVVECEDWDELVWGDDWNGNLHSHGCISVLGFKVDDAKRWEAAVNRAATARRDCPRDR